MFNLPKLRRTFPELISVEVLAPIYTKPHEPIDYSKVDWSGKSRKGELHNGSASHLHCEGQCSTHCSLTMSLDQKYQDGFKTLPEGQDCPPCPNCNGKMIPWDAWLVTGAKCEDCGWNMSEGTGCLL